MCSWETRQTKGRPIIMDIKLLTHTHSPVGFLWALKAGCQQRGTDLVVIRERDDRCTHSQDHGWVNLTVCVCWTICHTFLLQVIWSHCQHHSLFFQGVNVLYYTTGHEILPTEQPITQLTPKMGLSSSDRNKDFPGLLLLPLPQCD